MLSINDLINGWPKDEIEVFNIPFKQIIKNIPIDLYELFAITILTIKHNSLTHISNLDLCTNLKSINFTGNSITKIEGLNNLVNLEQLYLSQNKITKIQGLDELTNLIHLYLNFNRIEVMEGLSNLQRLECLVLSNNQIKTISGLTKSNKLHTLNLEYNNITVISGLGKNLLDLNYLSLYANPIEELIGLENVSSINNFYITQRDIKKGPTTIKEYREELERKRILNYELFWIDYYIIRAIINNHFKGVHELYALNIN
jgi:Leucine-rich repeat (LRR) protein